MLNETLGVLAVGGCGKPLESGGLMRLKKNLDTNLINENDIQNNVQTLKT